MAEGRGLTAADHVMIHAMQVLSRPPLLDRRNIAMQVGMLRDALPRVSRDIARLRPVIDIATKFADQRPCAVGDYGGLHHRAAQVMNDWDARRLADAWEQFRGPA